MVEKIVIERPGLNVGICGFGHEDREVFVADMNTSLPGLVGRLNDSGTSAIILNDHENSSPVLQELAPYEKFLSHAFRLEMKFANATAFKRDFLKQARQQINILRYGAENPVRKIWHHLTEKAPSFPLLQDELESTLEKMTPVFNDKADFDVIVQHFAPVNAVDTSARKPLSWHEDRPFETGEKAVIGVRYWSRDGTLIALRDRTANENADRLSETFNITRAVQGGSGLAIIKEDTIHSSPMVDYGRWVAIIFAHRL